MELSQFVTDTTQKTQTLMERVRADISGAYAMEWSGKAGEYYRKSLAALLTEVSAAGSAIPAAQHLCIRP
ncbi:hypothetical protein ACOVJL_03910 [Scardovia wiggsiae]